MISLVLLFALAAPNSFLGSWRLVPEKSQMEPGAPPPQGSIVMSYVEEGDHVKVVATITTPDGNKREIIHTQTYDGKPHDRYEGKPNGETLTHRRIDDRTEETTWRKDGNVMIVTTRTVSDDGKTLKSVVRVPGKDDPVSVMVYEKQ